MYQGKEIGLNARDLSGIEDSVVASLNGVHLEALASDSAAHKEGVPELHHEHVVSQEVVVHWSKEEREKAQVCVKTGSSRAN